MIIFLTSQAVLLIHSQSKSVCLKVP